MKLGIVGNGVVGGATAAAFASHEVLVHDVDPARSRHSLADVLATDIILCCLPTPQRPDGLACDLSAVEGFFADVVRRGAREQSYVLRSTVPIGATRRLAAEYGLTALCHSPEFLTARTAKEDAANPARNIIGMPFANRAGVRLVKLYKERFPQVPLYTMTSDESEAVKLFQNAFSAIKIATFNEFHSLATKLNLDWPRVRDALLAGGWISPHHTEVPGPDGRYGYGGSCLPKDLASLVYQMEQIGTWEAYPYMGNAALQRNKLDRERT